MKEKKRLLINLISLGAIGAILLASCIVSITGGMLAVLMLTIALPILFHRKELKRQLKHFKEPDIDRIMAFMGR